MRRTGIRNAWLLMLCLLTVSAAAAQNLQKKVKNAKGIEVIYQSSYKGKIRPGQIKMTVSGNQVALESVSPKGGERDCDRGAFAKTNSPSSRIISTMPVAKLINGRSCLTERLFPPQPLSNSVKGSLLPAKASIWD